MTRNTKIILGVLGGVLLLTCLCAGSIAAGFALFAARTSASVSVNPERVEQAAVRVDPSFAIPEGWRTDYAVHVGEIEVVGYRKVEGTGHIILAYLGDQADVDLDQFSRELNDITGQRYSWAKDETQVIERRKILIGDQETEVVITKGRSSSSGMWRQAITMLQGERGLTVAVLGLPAAEWSEQALDEFIYAIH